MRVDCFAPLAMTSSRNGRDQHDLIAFFNWRFHTLQVFDIILANEQIDERAQFTGFVEQMRFDSRELCCQIVQRFGNFCAADGHFAVAAGVGT